MKPRLLVISPVHPPDDPRIRHKLIRTLQEDWDIIFAGVGRGPLDQSGLTWRELPGRRLRRSLRASWIVVRGGYDLASLHDPEMLPAALLASLLNRKIVFDVHENIPEALEARSWMPRPLLGPARWVARRLLLLAERRMAITLAEAGYSPLFVGEHPVFPNYLIGDPPPPQAPDPEVGLLYLGDITEARGLALAVEAAHAAGIEVMTLLGRCHPDFKERLIAIAGDQGPELRFHGFVTPDRALGMAARAVLGLSPLLDTPNYARSLPTKVLEYLAVGLPTVASDLPGTRAVLDGKPGALLIPPGDLAAWTRAIAAAYADSDLRRAAAEGVPVVRAAYVWPREAVREFYARLVAT